MTPAFLVIFSFHTLRRVPETKNICDCHFLWSIIRETVNKETKKDLLVRVNILLCDFYWTTDIF